MQTLLQKLHFALVREDKGGGDVFSVGDFQDGAGELAVIGHVVYAPLEHHLHLHGLALLYEELLLSGLFWVEFILPPAWSRADKMAKVSGRKGGSLTLATIHPDSREVM